MNRVTSYFLGRISQGNSRERSCSFRFKFNLLTFLLIMFVLSLIYQIITGLYGLFLYNRRLKEGEMLLREKLSLIENLEAQKDDFGWSVPLAPEEVNKEASVSER